MKSKKNLIIAAAAVAFLAVILSWFFGWGVGRKEEGTSSQKPVPTVSQISLSEDEEPEIDLEINSDRSGGTLTVSGIAKRFSQVEYELIYLTENEGQEIERGIAGGPLPVSGGRVRETFIFGTESCTTGVCKRKIDKNVSRGTVAVRLIDPENRVWSTEKGFSIEKTAGGYRAVWSD